MKKIVVLVLMLVWCWDLAAQDDPTPDAATVWDGLPGGYQFRTGDPVLGTLAATGALLNFAPLFVPQSITSTPEYWVEKNGKHYFQWVDSTEADVQSLRVLRGSATMVGIWGGFFGVYGTWDTYKNTSGKGKLGALENLGMADFLLAPFQPENILNYDFFPVFPLLELSVLQPSDYQAIGGYFQRSQVNFAGYQVTPAAGLALTAATTMALVAANATLEEIAFRGIMLDRMGVWGSSIYFGSNHLINAFVLPNFAFEDAAMQATWATLFGVYAASRTQANGGDFRHMIALHFWHNVTEIVLSYLINPDQVILFHIAVPL